MITGITDGIRTIFAGLFVFVVVIVCVGFFTLCVPPVPIWLGTIIAIIAVLSSIVLTIHLFNYPDTFKPGRVTFDDNIIIRTMPDGQSESVRWDDLQEVCIITTDGGPWYEDIYWVLSGTDEGCIIAGGAEGSDKLLERLQQLEGFDNGAVIKASGCTSNNQFVCWRRGESVKATNP